MTHPHPALFNATIRVDHLPAAGRELSVSATPEELLHLAELMKVDAISACAAELRAEKFRGGIHVTGQLSATVSQACVVTFVPVEQTIKEPVDRIFLPGADVGDDSPPGSELFVDLESDDIPDHFTGSELDLTPLLMEVLGLAIDLYPRAPGAELPDDADDGTDDALHPFAALKALKPDSPKGD